MSKKKESFDVTDAASQEKIDDLLSDKDTSEPVAESPTAPPSTNPTYEQALGLELQEYAKLSVEYKKKIEEAKTDPKRKYYKKKLAKNNNKALQILLTLEEVSRLQANPQKVADLVATERGPNDEPGSK